MYRMSEIWKDVKGHEGYYQVSDLGRLKSLSRMVDFRGSKTTVSERIMSLCADSTGYLGTRLSKKGVSKSFKIHVLIAEAFLGYKKGNSFGYEGIVVDHLDNNPINNNLSNIQIITRRENCCKDRLIKNQIGASFHKKSNKWRARIGINGKQIYLGSYNSKEEAREAYLNKLKTIK